MVRRISTSVSFIGAATLLALGAAQAAWAADTIPPAVAAAVANPARPEADRARDANRKPAEVVAFSGMKPGDKVTDILPGGGYFTRVFSKTVGDKGVVYALTPPRPANAPAGSRDFAAAVKAIAADPMYANVRVGDLDPASTKPPAELVDVAWTSLNYHDMHSRPDADLMPFNKYVFNMVKPGGVFIVIDHAAAAGAGASVAGTLHRIDPAIVKEEVSKAGFVFEAESKVLFNPDDDHTAAVRDSSVSGHTDQFVFRFRKPRS